MVDHKTPIEKSYYLTDLLGAKVTLHGKKIGKLSDFVMVENGNLPEVTKLCVFRPYGDHDLLIPWNKIKLLTNKEVVLSIDKIESFQAEPGAEEILLKDHILDKKVLDIEDREVEVVYDVKMVYKHHKLFVAEANISRYRFFRRLGLKWLAEAIYRWRDHNKDQKIAWTFIQPLPVNISSFKGDVKLNVMKEKISDIHPADLADILEELDHQQRMMVFNELETGRASDTLEEIIPSVQRDLVSSLKKERVAQLVDTMTSGQAADILSVLPFTETKAILKLLSPENAKKIEAILEKQEEKISNFTTTKLLIIHEDKTVAQTRAEYYTLAKDKDVIMYIYIVDQLESLVGVIDLKELLRAEDSQMLKSIMVTNVMSLGKENTLREALNMFARYNFRAIPILDEQKKVLGAVPYRDIMNLKHRFWE